MFPQKKPSNALAAKMVGSDVPKPGRKEVPSLRLLLPKNKNKYIYIYIYIHVTYARKRLGDVM